MDSLKNNSGVTIIELLIASLVASVVFLAVASAYVSGLRLLTATQDLNSLDPAVALNLMTKNIALANQIVISDTGPLSGKQVTLRLDYNNVSGVPTTPKFTADTSDDFYIMYRFIGNSLRTVYGAASAVVTGANPEVLPGLAVTVGSFALFNPVGNVSNSVTISIQSAGKTLNTTAVAGAGPKS